MPRGQRRRNDDQLLLALACGASVDAAAKQCGLHPSTVYRRLEDAAFRRRIDALRAEMTARAAGGLTAAGLEAVKTLLDLMKAGAPAVKLGAARAVLELGLRFRETVHLQAEVDALEARLAALTGGRIGVGDPAFPRLIPPLALDAPDNDPA